MENNIVDSTDFILSRIQTTNENIIGILQKLEIIMDNNEYRKLYARYLELSKNLPKTEELTEEEKKYEFFGADLKYLSLDTDLNRFEQELMDYNDYKKISDSLKEIKTDSEKIFSKDARLKEFINKNKQLIKLLIYIKNDKNIQQFTKLLDEAINALFYSLMLLSMINNNELLEFIKQIDSDFLREHLASKIRNSIDTTAYKGNLDDDYVDANTLYECAINNENIIAQQNIAQEYEERQIALAEERNNYINHLQEKINDLEIKIVASKNNLTKLKLERANIYLKKLLFKMVAASAITLPLTSPFIGHSLGKKASSKILLTKTYTQTVDIESGHIISKSEGYEELNTTYVASVTICDPWEKNLSGASYSRNCTVYDYILPKDAKDDFRLTMEDINMGNLVKKYTYEEVASSIPNDKYLTGTQIYVTETYQDRNNLTPSTKYTIPYTISGLGVGIGIATTETIAYLLVIKQFSDKLKQKLAEDLKENKEASENTNKTLKLSKKQLETTKQKYHSSKNE